MGRVVPLDLEFPVAAPPQHLHVGRAYARPRFDAEFVHQAGAQITVDHQRLRLASGAVQGEHQLPVVRLPQRMLRGQRRQLGHEVGQARAAQGEFGVVAPFQEQQPRLGQPPHESVPTSLRSQPGQRGAPPQRERGRALPHHALPVARGVRGTGRGGAGVEDVDVQLAVVHPQRVPGGHGGQPLGVVEQPPQPGHVIVQRGLRGEGRRRAPHRVLQRVDGDDAPGVEQQHRQQDTELGAADVPHAAVGEVTPVPAVVQDRRSQQSEPQPAPCHAHHCLPGDGGHPLATC